MKNRLKNNQVPDDAAVYRVVSSNDGKGYSISAEFDGKVEITRYDENGRPVHRTYGSIPKKAYRRFKIQICPINEICLISRYVNLNNAAVIMCSSYPIEDKKASAIRNKLCLEFDDTTMTNSPRAFNIDVALKIKEFIDLLEQDIKVLYFCCDSGESRSTALAASFMRYFKMSDKSIWSNPQYHPNPLAYKMQCKALGFFITNIGIKRRIKKNQNAFRRLMNKGNK